MFEATNYISEYNVGDKFISFQYTNGKRFAQINVCQNKKVERNKKKIEVYQEGNAPLSLSFSTEDEAIEAFDLLNTALDTLRTNCQTASASSLLFPNGREIITSSRDFQQSDEGKILIVVGNNIALTMPDASIWTEVGIPIGLKFLQGYTGCSYEAVHGLPIKVLQLSSDGEFITVITGEYLGKSSVGTIADMIVNTDDGDVTLNKYLYDQSQNVIPLSGTRVGEPVSGTLEFEDNFIGLSFAYGNSGLFTDANADLNVYGANSLVNFKDNEVLLDVGVTTTHRGYTGSKDFTPNITDLDYTQKIYVGFRGTATLSSGTVIVATDKIKTGYKIYVSVNTPSGTQGFLSAPTGSIVDATSFVINSTNAGDNSTVNWWIAP